MSGGRRMAGAIAGGLAAGIGLTVLLIASERKSGTPSELVLLERAGARRLGVTPPPDDRLPEPPEQALVQGGHLLLSAAAGAAYALATDEETEVIPSGVGFGLAFYAAMHWIAGPLLGLKAPEWRSDRSTILMHAINHVSFGLATSAAARLASRAGSDGARRSRRQAIVRRR